MNHVNRRHPRQCGIGVQAPNDNATWNVAVCDKISTTAAPEGAGTRTANPAARRGRNMASGACAALFLFALGVDVERAGVALHDLVGDDDLADAFQRGQPRETAASSIEKSNWFNEAPVTRTQ